MAQIFSYFVCLRVAQGGGGVKTPTKPWGWKILRVGKIFRGGIKKWGGVRGTFCPIICTTSVQSGVAGGIIPRDARRRGVEGSIGDPAHPPYLVAAIHCTSVSPLSEGWGGGSGLGVTAQLTLFR